MASLRKRGKSWHVEVRMRGITQRASKSTRAEAMAWAVDVERRIRAGQGLGLSDRTLGDALARYAQIVSPTKAGNLWEQARLLHFQRDPIARERLSELTPAVLSGWRDRRLKEVSGGTIRRDMALLSHALKIAWKEWGWLTWNPTSDVRRPPDNVSRDRRVADAELAALKLASGADPATLTGRTIFAFEFAIETAMRGAEICAMERRHVHLPAYVHIPKSKNGTKRDVPLSHRAREILVQVLALELDPVWAMNAAQKDALYRKVADRAAVIDLHFHDSRHEALTRLAAKLSVLDLARLAGIRDLKTLMVYYNATATEIAQKING